MDLLLMILEKAAIQRRLKIIPEQISILKQISL